ncbi:MAG: radical SAM family heme chaperone HemW [Chlamydiae bacterium]|nr:radical SAM family heme chaperone HemW [Chlamydiota bacterium]
MDKSLYIHYPFCRKKCPYCHFFVLKYGQEEEKRWIDALLKEWDLRKSFFESSSLVSCYFGGGTPFLLSTNYFESILSRLPSGIEITVEMNPEDLSEEKLKELRCLGINRISIGVQSFDDHLLQILGRNHSAKRAVESIEAASAAGFENITIDLMYDIPHQKPSMFAQSLNIAKALPITHLSLYNLTIEPHTAFHRKKTQLQKKLPSDEESLKMLQEAISHFDQDPWERYEISAFAKKGYRSLHNLGYWQGREFLGLGPSAFSYLNGSRIQNMCNFPLYEKALYENRLPIGFTETLPPQGAFSELIAVGIRVKEGVLIENPSREFEEKLSLLINKGLIEKDVTYKLTEKGRLFYDEVAMELID